MENRVALNRTIVSTASIGPSLAFYRDIVGLSGPPEGPGGAVVDEPSDRPWGERQAVVRDPDGHLVWLTPLAG